MREIKFDVIVSMSKFSTVEHKTLEEAIKSEDVLIRGNEIIPNREVVLRQFTGLLDKNSIEIYEGDRYSQDIWLAGNREGIHNGVVIYETDRFGIKYPFGSQSISSLGEVIGNIYETDLTK